MHYMDQLDAWLTAHNLGFLGVLAEIVLVAAVARVAVFLFDRIVTAVLERKAKNAAPAAKKRLDTVGGAVRKLVKYLCIFVAAAIILGLVGLEEAMHSMLVAAGIGGLALSLGAQSLIGDVSAGIFMLLESQMDVGDFVRIGDAEGYVSDLGLRTTVLRGLQGQQISINNGQIKQVTNFTRGFYTVLLEVQIAYEADVDKARALMREEAAAYAAELGSKAEKAPLDIGLTQLGASGVTLKLGLRVEPGLRYAAENELRRRVKARFAAEEIEIPYDRLVILHGDRE